MKGKTPPQNDMDEIEILQIFAKVAVRELWVYLAERLCNATRTEANGLARCMAEAKRVRPRLRQRLNREVFQEMRNHVFKRDQEVMALMRMGVIRMCHGAVEFWSADAPLENPVMQRILWEAKRFRAMWDARVFQVVWHSKNKVYTLNWDENLTVRLLQEAVERLGVRLAGKALTYRKQRLTRGHLLEYGIGAASIVVLVADCRSSARR